jgi:4-hydroxy-3-polyprenylbenzoate decarboxylase
MEDAYIAKATERIFLAPIRLVMQPEVRDLYMPMEGTAHNLAFVSIAKRYEGQASKVAQGLWGAGQMMFNKYMLIARQECDIRSKEQMCELLRRVDLKRDILFSEGVLDVLDHTTPTLGYGSKLAIDLTNIDTSEEVSTPTLPNRMTPAGGVDAYRGDYLASLGLLVVFADKEWREHIDIDSYLSANDLHDVKYIAIFDNGATTMSASDLLWIAAANTDPKRDIRINGNTMIIDARSKRPGYGNNPSRFPNVVTSSPETISLVDSRWSEYGIGEMVESPSSHYRELLLSDNDQW